MKKYGKGIALVMSIVLCVGVLFGCSPKKSETGEVVKLATKPMTEQLIIGSMLKALIEKDTDLTVEVTDSVGGGTGNIQPAMIKGDFDMYPEYTGTGWREVLKRDDVLDDDALFEELQKEYKEQFNFEWVGMYGFGNMYGLAVRDDIAEQNNIKTFSDLAPHTKDLVFAAEYDFFERFDGYEGLCERYGYEFKSTKDMDIGLKYPAINEKQVDVMTIFTTDGQLSTAKIVELEDDKKFFPTYYCGTVIRTETLEKHPELKEVLMKMDGLISNEEMTAMNNDVDSNHKDPKVVAEDFLSKKGLL